MYDLPSASSARAPSFGFGSRYDFSKQSKDAPPPNTYQLPSTLKSQTNFSFGISREESKRAIEGHLQPDPALPGPGTYPTSARIGTGVKYSFGYRTAYGLRKENSPGPGAYEPQYEKHKGNYLLSTCKTPLFMTFSSKNLSRFPLPDKRKVPGPGTYDAGSNFAELNGGRFPSRSARGFFGARGMSTPGPGSYTLPSEFRPFSHN